MHGKKRRRRKEITEMELYKELGQNSRFFLENSVQGEIVSVQSLRDLNWEPSEYKSKCYH
jgi:hypothetical protein